MPVRSQIPGNPKDISRTSILPIKKPRGGKLTTLDCMFNKAVSSIRIRVEHTISRLKKYRIHAEVFRNRMRQYENMGEIVAGLVNL